MKGRIKMTREEAITLFEKQLTAAQVVLDSGFGSNPGENDILYRRRKEMAEIALSALRPVSRERVEKVWRGKWIHAMPILGSGDEEIRCSKCGNIVGFETDFCPYCGNPMTNEAVGMMMKRLEVLYEST